MAKREKDSWILIFLGPALVLVALAALWKNETRFDYYKAAKRIRPTESLGDIRSGQSLAYTGAMNPPSVVLHGQYVEQFVGYLVVYREAEIYAWDRDEDSDGDVTWRRRWMGSLESNSRNGGLRQQLSDGTILPPEYQVGDLKIDSQRMEFVDAAKLLPVNTLSLTQAGVALVADGPYFYLRKGRTDKLGDERLSYRAIPVPPRATYFGKFEQGRGVADRSQERTNFINLMIQDTGILHHIVAGERTQALATMKSYLSRLKWIVRGVGTFCVVFGFVLSFSKLVGFLFQFPVVGQLAEMGVWAVSLGLGIPLSLLTIGAGYLAGHPVFLVLFLCLLAAGVFGLSKLSRRGRESQRAMRRDLEREVGHSVDANELKELEFIGLAHTMESSGAMEKGGDGNKVLNDWSRKHRWNQDKQDSMLAKARAMPYAEPSEELKKLIRVAIADGKLTAYELRTIQTAAAQAGFDRNQLRELMRSVRRSAELRSNMVAER